jgi:ABC-type dipeptide/oligopeptide/nickel transport system ATPase subunit
VAKVRFKRFAIDLADGTTVEAFRPGRAHAGPYRLAILKGSETIDTIDLPVESGPETGKEERKSRVRAFLEKLSQLGIALHFLSDDRRIQGRMTDEEVFQRRRYREMMASGVFTATVLSHLEEERTPGVALKSAIHRATQWINHQAYKSSNTGQRNVHSIYSDIAQHIVESPVTDTADLRQRVDEMVQRLVTLSERSAAYSQYGLTSELPVDRMTGSLRSAQPDTLPILYNVIRPYVQSTEARLKALEGIHSLLKTFIANINSFFGPRKGVAFDIRHGFSIRTRAGELLDPDMLSSGEKQFLLLLCNTLATRDQASILIIDEPEISLNVKWQRGLVQALLDCIKGSNVQMIFATHSIELLARHKQHVVKLVDMATNETKPHRQDDSDERRREADDRRIGSEV